MVVPGPTALCPWGCFGRGTFVAIGGDGVGGGPLPPFSPTAPPSRGLSLDWEAARNAEFQAGRPGWPDEVGGGVSGGGPMGPWTPPQARSPLQKVKSQQWPTQEAKASVRWHRSPRRRWLQARLALASGRKLPEPPPCCSVPHGSWRLQGLTVSGASRSLGPILVHVEVTLGGDRRATTHPRPGRDPAGVRSSVKSRASELPEPSLVTRKGGFLRIPKGGL